jgi:TatD DNase family protein
MTLIDSHIHLYASEFENERASLIEAAILQGVSRFILPAIDSKWHAPLLTLSEQYPDCCLPMMGLHPCSVAADYKEELKIAEKNLAERKFYAVGEMGIDHYWDKTFIKEQDDAFNIQCKWANATGLPIAIHSREATQHVIRLLHQLNLPSLKGVFHCFSGTAEEAEEVIKMGFYLGIGGVSTFKNGGLDKLLPSIPLEYILLETDGPYLAPVPHRGKRNEPAYLKIIAQRVADIYNVDFNIVAEKTSANAMKLFRL